MNMAPERLGILTDMNYYSTVTVIVLLLIRGRKVAINAITVSVKIYMS